MIFLASTAPAPSEKISIPVALKAIAKLFPLQKQEQK